MFKFLQMGLVNSFKNEIRSYTDQVLGTNPGLELFF